MKCPYCDNELPFNATSCPSCGAQVQQNVQQPMQQPYAPQNQQSMRQYASQYQQPMQQYAPQYQQPMNAQMPQMNMAYNMMLMTAKSRTTYVLLAIFLGEFGIHSFYAGYNGKGTVQLLLTVLTAGYGGFISWIWAISNAFSVKNDARGIPFK